MTGLIGKTVLGASLAVSTLVAVAPADAQYHRGRRDRGGDVATGAIIGGIVGLGLGAAIASGSRRDRYDDRGYYYGPGPGGYYDDGYYNRRRPRVVYRERYYAPPPRVIYRDRYYRDHYYRGAPRGYYGY